MPPAKKDEAVKKTPARRTTTRKAAAPKTPAAKTDTPSQVASNAKHIAENTKEIQNNTKMIHLLYGFIIVLILIIAGLAFYIGTIYGDKGGPKGNTPNTNTNQAQEINITVIDDARCTDCQTDVIVGQLESLPFLSQATFIEKDFSDDGIKEYLEANNILALPAVIFNTNNLFDGGQLTPYLQALPDNQFSLALGASFNPFVERSENGYLMLEQGVLQDVLDGAYLDGNPDAQITWIEYSDLECPFCARLHNQGTPDELKEKYGESLNIAFQHFPLDFHPQALPGAQALECIAEQDESVYYSMIESSFETYDNNNFSLEGFYELAGELGIDTEALSSCVGSEKYRDKVLSQMTTGQTLFGVTGTPGNVIINNETGEYAVISWAYPASAFEEIIDTMIQ